MAGCPESVSRNGWPRLQARCRGYLHRCFVTPQLAHAFQAQFGGTCRRDADPPPAGDALDLEAQPAAL